MKYKELKIQQKLLPVNLLRTSTSSINDWVVIALASHAGVEIRRLAKAQI